MSRTKEVSVADLPPWHVGDASPLPRRCEIRLVLSVTLYANSAHYALFAVAHGKKVPAQTRPLVLMPVGSLPQTYGEALDRLLDFLTICKSKLEGEGIQGPAGARE